LTLQCYPFDYHPVKKDLKVYKTMLIKIDFNSTQRITSSQKLTSEFEKIAQNFFLNYPADRYDVMPEEGEMLIITPDIFAEALQPLADWKIKNGMQTTIVPLSVTGNSSNAIKSYITTFYHQHNLAFVLIVGDNQYFPTFIIDGKSCDNYYAEIAGNDNLPDIMLGKLSAETVEHVNIQVQKFIDYEKNPAETAHFSKFCGIASSEGPGDNNEYDYQHIRNIDNRLQAFTYTSGYELFAGNQGGLDAVGSPTSSMLTNVLNDGVGVLNYCGHGSDNGFVTTGFSSSHIATLNNYNKLPFIFAVACVNGNYVEQTCFAEAWLRAAKDGQPTGAVTTVMSTMNQPWNPPMCAQDEMNSLMTETYTHNIKRTFGGIVFNSLLKMMEVYDDELTMRTWITFGDPSLMVRTAVPSTLQVTHQTMLPLGVTEIQISSPMEGAKVALSVGHQIIAQGIIQNGVVLLPVQDLTPDDTLTVLASCFNYVPYQGSITFYTTNEPYLIYKSHTLHDSMGNNNGRLEYNEEAQLTLCIKNAGNVRADSIQMILATQDPYITLLDSTEFALVADSFATICLQDAFSIRVANDAPNQHRVNFVLKLFYSDTVFVRNFYQSIDAPVLSLGTCFINDSASTDFNGRLDYQ
ncbi:MAG: C25 family cysteine peptidase, partial [Bacteroidales bacterium]